MALLGLILIATWRWWDVSGTDGLALRGAPAAPSTRPNRGEAVDSNSSHTASNPHGVEGDVGGSVRFAASAQFGAGLLGWHPKIVLGSLWAGVGGLGFPTGTTAFVSVDDAGMLINTGWYSYSLAWDQVEGVYAPETNDPLNPRVLCVSMVDGGLMVLTEVALGANVQAVVDEVGRRKRGTSAYPP